jgi:hypothetical protein
MVGVCGVAGKLKRWRILDWGKVPQDGRCVLFTCLGCGNESQLPVLGTPMAQTGMGIVFDLGPHAMPNAIECRHCRRRYELDEDPG